MPSGLIKNFLLRLKVLMPVSLAFYAISCATVVAPSGGPKDITPPKMVSSVPVNLSTNYKGKTLTFTFDEFVQLKSPEKFLLISPPMSKLPDLKVKGRSIIIKLEDSLRTNTTYNFYLGEAIVDITENNPIPNFNFAFSTGPEIDSLSLAGNVTDAFTRMPVKGALVMLYDDFTDSVPMKQIPVYVSRTMENGDFMLNSLASAKYRAVALVDGNSDYMYNLPTELIGFSSDSVQPYYNTVNQNDTTYKLSDAETRLRVSIDVFPEPDSTQHILKSVIAAKNKLSVAFRYPMTSPGFRALNIPDSLPWSVQEWNRAKDTLNAWLLNKPDTLKLEILDKGIVIDTVKISTALKVAGKSKNTEKATPLKYATSLNLGKLGYNRSLILTFTNPVKEYDLQALQLSIMAKDTTTAIPVVHFTDSIHRHLLVSYNWNSTERYDLYIPKKSFTDIYSDTCDSTHVRFQMRPIEEYGSFVVTLNRPEHTTYPIIIQLLTEKGNVIDQKIAINEKRVDFGLLDPGKYGLKAILDANSNGRWDTGRFIMKIQPEKVLIHPKIFEVRTNWELEETWDL
jgi:hypothetical protein